MQEVYGGVACEREKGSTVLASRVKCICDSSETEKATRLSQDCLRPRGHLAESQPA